MRNKIVFIGAISIIALSLGGCTIIKPSPTGNINPVEQSLPQNGPQIGTPTAVPAPLPATSSVISKAEPQLDVYTDDNYGFSVSYPKDLKVENVFKQYYVLSNGWRAGADTQPGEKPLVSFPIYRTESNNSYPRYFAAEVRIGVSSNPQDVKDCLVDSIFGAASTTEDINGIDFTVYAIADAAMMQYMGGKSYRTVHNGLCYAVEQLKAGSSYRDDPKSAKDISDELLGGYYDQGAAIIKTFKFIK